MILFLLFLNLNPIFGFNYGAHIPQGSSAVTYAYSSEGTWKSIETLHYNWNYYEQWATANHPFDKGALISAANGPTFTSRDANGYLLCDFNKNLEIDTTEEKCGPAFHEHNGRGVGGSSRGQPFTQFWLDDNWLARYMSQAYSRPLPNGLTDQPGQFMRWKVIGGDIEGWSLYNSDHFDTLSLDGLYYLVGGQVDLAIQNWERCLVKSESFYDENNQQFKYPGIHENYHMGLWKILTEMLLNYPNQIGNKRIEILQHSVSLRSQILDNQQVKDGVEIGWISNIGSDTSLINTESISCGTLGLGANFKFVFETDRAPMIIYPGNFFTRPYHSVSAVVGLSSPGQMLSGPSSEGLKLGQGNYIVEFLLRTNQIKDSIASLHVFNVDSDEMVVTKIVGMGDFQQVNQWTAVQLPFDIGTETRVEFRVQWHGVNNLDVAVVRLK